MNNLSIKIFILITVSLYIIGCAKDNPTSSNNSTLSPPTLVYPINGDTLFNPNSAFRWNTVSGASSYNIQIASDSGFTNLLINQGVNTDSIKVSSGILNIGMQYFWHVCASNNNQNSNYSAYWHFKSIPYVITDSNVIIFDSIFISRFTFAGSNSAVNLYSGFALKDSDRTRDINMRDSSGVVFYLQTGDFTNPQGFRCLFNSSFSALTFTKSQFDTISVIPVGHDPLLQSDFPYYNTKNWAAFDSAWQGIVIPFYLKGKYDAGITPHQVFGLLYIWKALPGYTQLISVKINKAGKNKFVK